MWYLSIGTPGCERTPSKAPWSAFADRSRAASWENRPTSVPARRRPGNSNRCSAIRVQRPGRRGRQAQPIRPRRLDCAASGRPTRPAIPLAIRLGAAACEFPGSAPETRANSPSAPGTKLGVDGSDDRRRHGGRCGRRLLPQVRACPKKGRTPNITGPDPFFRAVRFPLNP